MTSKSLELTWQGSAVRLLGESLYSNQAAALSELIANSLDADAKNVNIYIDMLNSGTATISILDDGHGMNHDLLQKYSTVGFNRRHEGKQETTPSGRPVMGRKGIGKLAALYLSHGYSIHTKTPNETPLEYELIDPRTEGSEDERPSLVPVKNPPTNYAYREWKKQSQGTLVHMLRVTLNSKTRKFSLQTLVAQLSQHFSNSFENPPSLRMHFKGEKDSKYEEFNLQRTFSCQPNLLFIAAHSEDYTTLSLQDPSRLRITLPKHKNAPQSQKIRAFQTKEAKGEYQEIKYEIKGWIGIHATINSSDAANNLVQLSSNKIDDNFELPPREIRVYVRKKLAVRNLMPYLKITKTSFPYVEGEIEFDLLDEDSLRDIATSSREGFDEHDDRFQILINIVQSEVKSLIKSRDKLIDELKKNEEEIEATQKATLKKEIETTLKETVRTKADAETISNLIYDSLIQPASLKTKRKIFISHRSLDKPIADLVYEALKHKGAVENEFFYTSSLSYYNSQDTELFKTLDKAIKETISDTKTRIIYVVTNNFRASEYCMFEAGAGWALTNEANKKSLFLTNKIDELPAFFSSIAPAIPDNLLDMTHMDQLIRQSITENNTLKGYSYLRRLINECIEFLNEGRDIGNKIEKLPDGDDSPPENFLLDLWRKAIDHHASITPPSTDN